jgi:hypothetical protein
MVIQYPHTLTLSIRPEASLDINGNYVEGVPTTKTFSCRVESNTKGAKVGLVDGTHYVFSWIVYLPKGSDLIPVGSEVIINSIQEAKGEVKMFSKGQLNSRLWL